MNPEERHLLERAVILGEENNKILRGIRRGNRLSFIWKVVYWIAIVAVSYGAYIYVQPYADQLLRIYKELKGTAGSVQKVSNQLPDLEKFLNAVPK